MELSGQHLALAALTPREKPLVPFEVGSEWASFRAAIENLLPMLGIELWFHSCPIGSLVTGLSYPGYTHILCIIIKYKYWNGDGSNIHWAGMFVTRMGDWVWSPESQAAWAEKS